ncbi:MAG: hypothetical protein ACOYL3_22340 [Desulfuromonadaceae bacterium]
MEKIKIKKHCDVSSGNQPGNSSSRKKDEYYQLLEQVGDRFGIKVVIKGEKTTAYFKQMSIIASILIILDSFLVTFLPLKVKFTHLRHEDSVDDQLYIDVETGITGEIGELILIYLRSGKELILSRLPMVSKRQGFDLLIQDLTELVNLTCRNMAILLSSDENSTHIKEVDLIRLLDEIWRCFEKTGRSVKSSLVSIEGAPEVYFSERPPFEEWLGSIDDDVIHTWRFKLIRINFEKEMRWQALMVNISEKDLVDLVIADQGFIDKIRSSERNAQNGLLNGDILIAKYKIENDQLKDKRVYKVIEVVDQIRGDVDGRQEPLNLT